MIRQSAHLAEAYAAARRMFREGDRVLLVGEDPVARAPTGTEQRERGWRVLQAAGAELPRELQRQSKCIRSVNKDAR